MHWTFTCDCGRAFATRSEDDIVTTAQRHIVALHPSVALPPSRNAVLAMARTESPGRSGRLANRRRVARGA